MSRLWAILNRFTGGEISPAVWGRTDTDQWPAMLEEMRNCISDPRGGAKRRSGLHYVVPTKYPTRKSRLIPFVFSQQQSYILEFGHYYVRFFRNQGWVEDIGNVVSHLGDGSSLLFAYEYDDTLEADIEVYLDGVLQTITTDYTTAAIDLVANQVDSFDVPASWDVDHNNNGTPWVLNLDTAKSPGDEDPVLSQDGVTVAQGATMVSQFTLDSFTPVTDDKTSTNATNTDLNILTYTGALSHTLDEAYESMTWALSFELFNNVTDTITYRVTRNDVVIAEAVVPIIANISEVISIPATDLPSPVIGDVLLLEAISTSTNGSSNPLIRGLVTTTTFTTIGVINSAPGWRTGVEDANGVLTIVEESNTPGVRTNDLEIQMPQPFNIYIKADKGAIFNLSALTIKYQKPGFIVTFVTAPPLGSVVTIIDKAKVDATTHHVGPPGPTGQDILDSLNLTERVRRPRTAKPEQVASMGVAYASHAPFEIQSPYSEDDLEELHFAQANDVMVICHDKYKPYELIRYNPYDWRFDQNEFVGAPWEEPAYNPLDGYPRTVAFFQERLYFGGTVAQPQTLWGSRAADFHEFTLPGAADPYKPDDAVEYTIAAYTHEAIEWLSSERVLIIGTSATEHRLAPDQFVATDRLPTVTRMSAYGGAHVMPAYMGNLTVFVQTLGNQVRSYEQSSQTIIEKWESIELDWMAGHLTAPRVKQLGFALNPDSILFMVTLDGDMLSMTYEPGMGDKQEVGWARHITDGNFISAATIPEVRSDEVWAIVEREIEGQALKYVEYFDDRIYTDSTLTYPDEDFPDDPPLQTVGGLGHLEGKTVTIKTDGATHPDLTVINGQVELNDTYQNIEIGLKYTPKLKLQRFAMAGEPANLQGMKGRWVEVWLRLVDSAYPLVDGVRAAERRAVTPMNDVEPVVTADVKVYNLGFDRNKQLVIEQDLPVPMHVTAVFGVIEIGQG